MTCRLIPFDKNPSLFPTGIGEILCRIAGKVIVSHIRKDLISLVCSLQVCPEYKAGCEWITHALHKIYEEDKSEAILLVDPSNAFNPVNRKTFLHNIGITCLPRAKFVRNCYSYFPTFHHWCRGNWIYWRDNSRRSHRYDNLCHSYNTAYSHDNRHYTSRWFIHGKIIQLKKWWDALCQLSPKFGYYPEGVKS